MSDARQHWPAAERNRGPILEILARVLPKRGRVLEVASGTGQHVAHFAQALPHLHWQPSDVDSNMHDSVAAWTEGLANVLEPIVLDVTQHPWALPTGDAYAAIYNANMIHIAPWEVCVGLMRGASEVLPVGGVLVLYGPFRMGGEHTAESNARFDESLRSRDARFGVRNLEDVVAMADEHGLQLTERIAMPANNLMLVFTKR